MRRIHKTTVDVFLRRQTALSCDFSCEKGIKKPKVYTSNHIKKPEGRGLQVFWVPS